MEQASAYLPFMGFDFAAVIHFEVTAWGTRPIIDYANGGDPGWPPEWEIRSIVIRRDDEYSAPDFDATGALFDCLCQSPKIISAVDDCVATLEMDRHCRRLRRRA